MDMSQAAHLASGLEHKARLGGSALERWCMGVSMSQASSCRMGITTVPY